MAEDAVDTAVRGLGSAQAPCRTKRWPVIGAASRDELRRLAGVLPARLVNRYGAEAPRVAALARHDPRLLRPLVPGIPVLGVEVLFAVRCEGALDVGDVLDRRTRAGLVPSHRAALEPLVAELAETAVPAR
jgi:glycerol-3-phosphate dehydrogenase